MEQEMEGRVPFAHSKQVEEELLGEYQQTIVAIQKTSMDLLWVCIGMLLVETDRGERWRQAERAMENQFRKDPASQPRHVAIRVGCVRGIEVRLRGLLLVRAQMIKRRVVMRQRRGGTGKETRGRAKRDLLVVPSGNARSSRSRELQQQFEEVMFRISQQRVKLLEICLTVILKHLGLVDEWTKVDSYMEALFTEHPSYTPWRVASQARHYHRINQRMMPKLIRLAQLAKKRVMFRRKWKADREEGGIWAGLEQPMKDPLDQVKSERRS